MTRKIKNIVVFSFASIVCNIESMEKVVNWLLPKAYAMDGISAPYYDRFKDWMKEIEECELRYKDNPEKMNQRCKNLITWYAKYRASGGSVYEFVRK